MSGNDSKIFTHSRRVFARDFSAPWFADRCAELRESLSIMHRKLWEFAAIAQVAMDEVKLKTTPNALFIRRYRVLGFGVGLDSLASWFASQGCEVLATDAPISGPWDGQYARSIDDIYKEKIIDRDTFDKLVTFDQVDMNDVSRFDEQGFDFTYSCGSFEHIGGIDASLAFFCNQMRALKPGGIAAHTTEYNFGSNSETINAKDLVLFRQQDLLRLDLMLREQGDRLFSLDFTGGDLPEDKIIDVPPYTNPVHLALRIGSHVSTSIILIAQRGER